MMSLGKLGVLKGIYLVEVLRGEKKGEGVFYMFVCLLCVCLFGIGGTSREDEVYCYFVLSCLVLYTYCQSHHRLDYICRSYENLPPPPALVSEY